MGKAEVSAGLRLPAHLRAAVSHRPRTHRTLTNASFHTSNCPVCRRRQSSTAHNHRRSSQPIRLLPRGNIRPSLSFFHPPPPTHEPGRSRPIGVLRRRPSLSTARATQHERRRVRSVFMFVGARVARYYLGHVDTPLAFQPPSATHSAVASSMDAVREP
ncbi:hypothetical protein GALMADRAFT_162480 [Galerina marginata CBS 339.88]|uniref:Uncharacterized protein n=1 Tax=Galerina marginata (strain CBS 339.88) TaxID=685588 RepID=A0A067SBH8_GALM3|nr:hypothetical protein GALMADRAFT_162480 [Galerina marginata CBS 339.88]